MCGCTKGNPRHVGSVMCFLKKFKSDEKKAEAEELKANDAWYQEALCLVTTRMVRHGESKMAKVAAERAQQNLNDDLVAGNMVTFRPAAPQLLQTTSPPDPPTECSKAS